MSNRTLLERLMRADDEERDAPRRPESPQGTMRRRWREQSLCPRCELPAFAAESRSINGYRFHDTCYVCSVCKTGLTSVNVAAKDCEIFCKKCYGRTYGIRGYGYGMGAGALSMTMTSLQHQDCVRPIHNPATQLLGLGLRGMMDTSSASRQEDVAPVPLNAVKAGRYVKTTVHDNIITSNVPKTGQAYCFPKNVGKTLLASERAPQKAKPKPKPTVNRTCLPPNTIAAVPLRK